MREYEAALVLRPDLEDAGVNALIGQLTDLLGRQGATVASTGQLADKKGHVAEVTEGWKARRLAYKIGGHREGYFIVLRFSAPTPAIDELEQALKINEDVLRHLVIRTDA